MALNGGVSLAVWMGGCAVEFDAARRANLGADTVAVAPPERSPGQRVRSRLWQFVTGEPPPQAAAAVSPPSRTVYAAICDAFERRLVIDIMSGASAGGINGALLSAALRSGRRLHPDFIRSRWLDLGDFSRLLHPTTLATPRSLMQGERFYADLHAAFTSLLAVPDDTADRLVLAASAALRPEREKPKLEVTTTDVLGVPRAFDDAWGNALEARNYRARFSFREPEDFTIERLAQAARASASFPVAFEPWHVSPRAAALAGFDESRWVVDGGLLDNAPIAAALDLIPSQPAQAQVRRFVCYVNADPVEPPPAPPGAGGPELQSVVGYVATLPRKAPFVDQLDALERATRRSRIGAGVDVELLLLDLEALRRSAVAMLPAYRRRRRLLSLEELLVQPSEAARAFAALDGGEHELPWIPDRFPPEGGTWHWGIRPAQRVVHLLLDVLRRAIGCLPFDQRTELLEARAALDEQLQLLELARRRLVGDKDVRDEVRRLLDPDAAPGDVVARLGRMTTGYQCEVPIQLRTAGEIAFGVAHEITAALEEAQTCTALFGDGWQSATELDGDRFRHLLRRALAIEVVRRAFSAEEDIESAQQLRFAQLTPFTPSPLFTNDPATESGWATPRDKLTGLELGHFAAFYRRSWRANDFMWGRLDAAVRVVEMLVDPVRAIELVEYGEGVGPWATLAEALVPDDVSAEQRWLLEEVLPAAPEAPAELRVTVAEALRRDLLEQRGDLTRTICPRAAQLEIVAHELPVLEHEALADTKLGAGTGPLKLRTDQSLRQAIEELRPAPDKEPLPQRLGRESGELGSSLALRTIAHAALVALALLRTAKLPLAGVLFAARAALLPMAGTVSRVPAYRLGVALGFWAAALYLAARMLTMDAAAPDDFGLLIAKDTLGAMLAVVIVLGVAAVPLVRARQPAGDLTGWLRRTAQFGAFLLLLAAGGLAAALLARLRGDGVSWSDVIVAPDAEGPPEFVLGAGIVLLAGPIAAGLLPPARRMLGGLLAKPWGGGLFLPRSWSSPRWSADGRCRPWPKRSTKAAGGRSPRGLH